MSKSLKNAPTRTCVAIENERLEGANENSNKQMHRIWSELHCRLSLTFENVVTPYRKICEEKDHCLDVPSSTPFRLPICHSLLSIRGQSDLLKAMKFINLELLELEGNCQINNKIIGLQFVFSS